jgi:BirA family transcriptional regulator, biotin operon repressor / biotin---[acetyl-CoA-carboxylase] ligase
MQVEYVPSPEIGALDIEELQRQLETQFFGVGDRLLYLPTVDSTNIRAMQLAHERPQEGVVVLTDSQTAGKGRLGRRWVDVFGRNVLCSTLLRPLFPPYLLVMLASLAVVDAISETCAVSASIKWPNDVLIGNRKVAGTLIETSHDASGQLIAILGIGVNVNGTVQDLANLYSDVVSSVPTASASMQSSQQAQVPLSVIATTLETACGRYVSRETFIAHLLRYIEAVYLALQHETRNSVATTHMPVARALRERWRTHLSTLGRAIEVRQGDTIVSGIAEDVDETGELLLRVHSGKVVTITWGDVGYSAG